MTTNLPQGQVSTQMVYPRKKILSSVNGQENIKKKKASLESS